MLIRSDQSLLLLIDLQERLAPAIEAIDDVLRHNLWLVEIAQRLAVPVAATVQYPAGLGPMVPVLGARIPAENVVEKICFSAAARRSQSFTDSSVPPELIAAHRMP